MSHLRTDIAGPLAEVRHLWTSCVETWGLGIAHLREGREEISMLVPVCLLSSIAQSLSHGS